MASSTWLSWNRLAHARDGAIVEIEGWMAPVEFDAAHSYFFLAPELSCCLGCTPRDPHRAVEVFAAAPVPIAAGPVRLRGAWRILKDDPNGWRWQLRDARAVGLSTGSITRRSVLGGALALPFAAPAVAQTDGQAQAAKRVLAETPGIDIHSHAGGILRPGLSFTDVVAQMKQGGMGAICLAMVADSPVIRAGSDGRIQAQRNPEEGELYRWSGPAFARVVALAKEQGLALVDGAQALRAASAARPSIVVSAEGGDFLEGRIERIDQALAKYGMRHLQLTHYRPNELGDIQTEEPVHNGLTGFGAEVIRRCNALGIVVDVAHGTFDLVKRAAEVTSKPLVVSHTSLTGRPGPRSRQISPEHAKIVARTGGVIGVWPPGSIYPTMQAMAAGMARLADTVGVDHVGIGSDQRGLTGPSVFDSYTQLPDLAQALLARGFNAAEVGKIVGGNYLRVFAQTLG
ncbi:MAG: dipeptidase [Reyranellaceae bacterium]